MANLFDFRIRREALWIDFDLSLAKIRNFCKINGLRWPPDWVSLAKIESDVRSSVSDLHPLGIFLKMVIVFVGHRSQLQISGQIMPGGCSVPKYDLRSPSASIAGEF